MVMLTMVTLECVPPTASQFLGLTLFEQAADKVVTQTVIRFGELLNE